jgi:hypothetical protein
MRVKSKWHNTEQKSINEIGSAIAFNIWRITKNQLEDLINEGFVVEKEQVFDVIQEYLCYLIQCTDRLVFDQLPNEQRQQLIIHVAKQSSYYYQENKEDRIAPGNHIKSFIETFNSRTHEYGDFDFIDDAPSNQFLCYFGEKIKHAMTNVDEVWIAQQMIEIQGPTAFEALAKSIENTVSVKNITSTKKLMSSNEKRIPRSKRISTRPDLALLQAKEKPPTK